ncbi:MAG: hypothetical protein K8S27_06735, partial [Candidatus Omnitrophica bacterium]|nr:hypothetical protein [Candidatus Omnitrophota bacterium]
RNEWSMWAGMGGRCGPEYASEPKKKSFKWSISENKILDAADVEQLRDVCLKFKEEGIKIMRRATSTL